MPTLQQDTQSTQTDPNPTGLSSEQLHEIRKELVEFAEQIFEPMPRSDQRRWWSEPKPAAFPT